MGFGVPSPQEYRPQSRLGERPAPSPQVSILLPAFNGGRFIDEQLHSVLTQTFGTFELLIYDDGSADGSWPIIEARAQADPRIRAWPSPTNTGQGAALSFLREQALAPLISFCDQDDVWAPDKLQLLVHGIGQADLAYGRSVLIDENGELLVGDIFQFVGPPISGRDPVAFLSRNTVSAHAMLVRRACLRPHHLNGGFDFDHLIAIAAAAGNGVVYVPDAVTHHRIHGANQVHGSLGNWDRHRKTKDRAKIRARKLRALVALSGAVAGNPHAPALTSLAFERLYAIANDLLANKDRVFRKRLDLGEVDALLRSVSSDAETISTAVRRFSKLARGPLHPSNWSMRRAKPDGES